MSRDEPYRDMRNGLWATRCPEHRPPAGWHRPMFEVKPQLDGKLRSYHCRPSDLDDPEVTVR